MAMSLGTLSKRPDLLAALFCAYATMAVIVLALLMPPFQAADELTQFERADQVALGALVATATPDGSTGGRIDRAIPAAGALFDGIRFHPEHKVNRPMLDAAGAIAWKPAGRGKVPFPNTAIYPPVLYGPAAIAIDVGRITRLSVPRTLALARLVAGASSIAIAVLAIAGAGEMAPFLFTLLCLPMPLALFASVSQDGPMIALATLAASRLRAVFRHQGRGLVVACLALALVLMARPPYLPVACILLAPPALSMRRRLAAFAAVILPTVCWSVVARHWSQLPASAVAISRQLHALGAAPWRFPEVVANSIADDVHAGLNWGREFIGVLGWLDTPLPLPYYAAAGAVLLAALASSCPQELPALPGRVRLAVACCIAAACLAILFFQYLSWTPTGARFIEGVQGRYFLPLALLSPLVLPRLRMPASRLRATIRIVLCIVPAFSIALVVRAIVWRYYL
ncbi:DUF2142 domain-containing protein [Lichenicoccus roseus]|uniref:DUF2142 domain-containing protein n=1 Tax=Lichenicoccus roseus TaxID=2683649 RepID=A0A5R9J7Z0_9PROT|nr:DUF2142 domain-containing protein [Lichenicoccus roseus]TLU73089.1 DUF2142 domain-containing protein [Lichenicoccus roseus]